MKLFYYKDSSGNYGDDLNPLIWYKLYPELFFDSQREGTVLGIGTLINSRAPIGDDIFVCGSGVGYHQFPELDDKWNFVFVRGPLSARKVGISDSLAITDPAILVARIFDKRAKRRNGIAYMPHQASNLFADWREVCNQLGMTFLDPTADVSETTHLINSSELVVAEAMHAAIVADALRVPWIPVKAYPHILDFKWQDWCSSLNMEYSPHVLPALWDTEQFHDKETIFKSKVKKVLMSMGVPSTTWTPPLPDNNKYEVFEQVLTALGSAIANGRPMLSRDEDHQNALERVEETMLRFSRGDVRHAA